MTTIPPKHCTRTTRASRRALWLNVPARRDIHIDKTDAHAHSQNTRQGLLEGILGTEDDEPSTGPFRRPDPPSPDTATMAAPNTSVADEVTSVRPTQTVAPTTSTAGKLTINHGLLMYD